MEKHSIITRNNNNNKNRMTLRRMSNSIKHIRIFTMSQERYKTTTMILEMFNRIKLSKREELTPKT